MFCLRMRTSEIQSKVPRHLIGFSYPILNAENYCLWAISKNHMFIPNIFSLRKYELKIALTKRKHLFELENML